MGKEWDSLQFRAWIEQQGLTRGIIAKELGTSVNCVRKWMYTSQAPMPGRLIQLIKMGFDPNRKYTTPQEWKEHIRRKQADAGRAWRRLAALRADSEIVPCQAPTDVLPGTPQKIEVLRERYQLGQELFHPLDATFGD